MLRIKYITVLLVSLFLGINTMAQEGEKSLTKEKILSMTTEELSALDLDDLMAAIDIVGVSSLEELYELLLNKDVTSASKSEESLFDSPLSTTVLSHEQIIASGATSIEEALRLVPGVIVREKTNGNYDVHIRGNDNLPAKNMLLYSENMNTLVMINGRPVFNYSHGGTLWETLPVSFEDIDRIEVVRGPASALYGPNALSGVINIITQNITKESPLVSGNVQAGTLNTYLGDVAFRKKISDKFNIGLTGNFETRDREREELLIYDRGGAQYSLDGNPVDPGYFTRDEINRMQNGTLPLWPPYDVKGETYDIYKSFPDPDQAKERMGVNAYLDFMPNENTTINLMAGHQQSQAVTSSMGDVPTPYTTKVAATSYVDLRANYKGLSLQANYNGGTIDYMAGNEGFELDNEQFNIQAEYDWNLGKVSIRPGVSYQSMSYDDSKHIAKVGNGYLNEEQTINIFAGSARFDYRPTDKLRLVAALRAEQYNNPDDIYASWQFVGSYKLNDNNIIRAVYSRANQSSFLVNTYSNYTWNIVNMPYPRVMQFDGNKSHDLKTMDMIELGYRTRPTKNLLIDFEAFYNVSEGFGALMPVYTNLAIKNPLAILTQGAQPLVLPDSVNIQYTNLDLKSKQLGASINIDWVINAKLVANAHFTVQQTKLDNYMPYNRNELIGFLAAGASANTEQTDAATLKLQQLGYGLATGAITPADVPSQIFYAESSTWPTDTKDDYEHKSTPSYFGGFSLTYRPIKKLEIFPQAYFYGEQTYEGQYSTENIAGKFLLNTKVSYKANDNLTFFVNGRNILNMKDREFAYMDEIPGMVLGGLNFKF
ncbi:TonB-dependent receptor [Carboxylicivirga sp. A043]|uniref:TonB-dependent receptor plug domain-containing protein n=1 Tax=Carboxylicivirga litoralis TaxID=2816963 RepID=UPI0021CB8646|nr:TonB-dependent receptor [Carboxylicivirga sp. A043]MCU4156007.1 TonB-dependent receptor [Carboxylicivirga sp. A043]